MYIIKNSFIFVQKGKLPTKLQPSQNSSATDVWVPTHHLRNAALANTHIKHIVVPLNSALRLTFR